MSEKNKAQETVSEKTERLVAKLLDHCAKHDIECTITAKVDGGVRACANGNVGELVDQINLLIEENDSLRTALLLDRLITQITK